ncbi:patr class I histocompatibility antigen, A-5 alpha chain-like isoform X2 [Alosa sapidissima]|uniref:patr class I histocompatibility antigen, A-5 alpha chain-like isoform X2 n=1 Tax=Alosa sapidissima TaxID=34773 RepID=UPI001C099482|nr:patr class I histocompatibility antigen, A-5 alpha chain-like isoform X2 [Alosa sapidissima]
MGCALKLAVLFGCLPFSTAGIHTLEYFYAATSGNFPEFISVGVVDGVVISQYERISQKQVPKQDWMKQLDQDYWDSETRWSKTYDENFTKDIKIVRKRFNQTGGVHVLQKMYGCRWDIDSGATDGYEQFGYDGEDFLLLDLKSMRWIAVLPQAGPSKAEWDRTESAVNRRAYFQGTCIEWLKKYVQFGSSTLRRKVSPEVTLLQKDSFSPVVCHATGFYPEGVMITWKRDGVEMEEDVDVGETLPNHDGTFQKRAVLTVPPEERRKAQYTCEVAHQSGKTIIRTLTVEDGNILGIGIGIGFLVAALVVIGGIVGIVMMKMKTGFKKAEHTDTDSSNSERYLFSTR